MSDINRLCISQTSQKCPK